MTDFDADPEMGMLSELDQVSAPSETAFKVREQRERTRSKIALYYVMGFMVIVALAMICSFILLSNNKLNFENLTNTLVTISGILSGPLGFIIGYYFKAEGND